MRLTTLRLVNTSTIRELQGTIRAVGAGGGVTPAVERIDTVPEGILVTGLQGQQWLVTPVGVGEVRPDPVPPPMPVTTTKGKT